MSPRPERQTCLGIQLIGAAVPLLRTLSRRRVALVGLALVVSGCGGRQERLGEPPDETGGDEHGAEHTGVVTTGPHAGCPASISDPGPSCQGTDVVVTECTYPEGTCGCGVSAWCGGAAPPPRPREWICRPNRPACGADGSPCDTPGASCALDDCGFVGVRCTDGTWHAYHGPYPP